MNICITVSFSKPFLPISQRSIFETTTVWWSTPPCCSFARHLIGTFPHKTTPLYHTLPRLKEQQIGGFNPCERMRKSNWIISSGAEKFR